MKGSADELLTRRRYLILRAVFAGYGIFAAMEAVASAALGHPEWDMDELASWDEWEAR